MSEPSGVELLDIVRDNPYDDKTYDHLRTLLTALDAEHEAVGKLLSYWGTYGSAGLDAAFGLSTTHDAAEKARKGELNAEED